MTKNNEREQKGIPYKKWTDIYRTIVGDDYSSAMTALC